MSPTLAEDLLRCRLRAVRTGVGDGEPVRGPALALGLACHEVAEQMYRGAYDSLEELGAEAAIREAFDAAITKQRDKMQDTTATGTVPGPRRWKNHNVIRRRLPRFLAAEVRRRREGVGAEALLVEEEMSSQDGIIFGFPDRVESDEGEVRVVDLKSGLAGSGEMPPQHRRQLLIYAYLWHEETGAWPKEAAVQRADGRMEIITVDVLEAETLIALIRKRRDDANAANTNGEDPRTIAEPGPEACRSCRRRPRCLAYCEALDQTWDLGGVDVLGVVEQVIDAEDGAVAIDLNIVASNLANQPQEARVLGVAGSLGLDTGDRVAVLDAWQPSEEGVLRLQVWSNVRRR